MQKSTRTFLNLALGVLLSVLSIAMLFFSMPPYGFWPLMILGFAPMLLAQYRLLPRKISSLAPAVTIGSFFAIFLAGTFGQQFYKITLFYYLIPGIFVLVFLAESGARKFHEKTGFRYFVIEGAVAWMGIEMIRNLIPFIGTGGFVAYSFYKIPALIQPVLWVGVLGMGLLIMVTGYTIGLGVLMLYDRFMGGAEYPVPLRNGLAWLKGTAAVVVVWVAASLVLYTLPLHSSMIKTAALSPAKTNDFNLMRQMVRQAGDSGSQLIVLPEGNLHEDPSGEKSTQIQKMAQEAKALVVLGVGIKTSQGLRNEAVGVNERGEILPAYGKDHPLSMLGETSLTRGTYPIWQAGWGKAGAIICYDLQFTDTSRRMARGGAQVLAVPSNDWPELTYRQVAYAVFRAVENRMAVVKADTLYDSLVIDPKGNLVAAQFSSAGAQSLLLAEVPLGTGNTPYSVLGDIAGWFCLIGMVALPVINGIRLRNLSEK